MDSSVIGKPTTLVGVKLNVSSFDFNFLQFVDPILVGWVFTAVYLPGERIR